MDIRKAIEITGEIVQPLKTNEIYPLKKCGESHPKNNAIKCEKQCCSNGKHYGIIGQSPNRTAIVWDESEALKIWYGNGFAAYQTMIANLHIQYLPVNVDIKTPIDELSDPLQVIQRVRIKLGVKASFGERTYC